MASCSVHSSHPRAKSLHANASFAQRPAKCRTFQGAYKDRKPLRGLPGTCRSIFGCCAFPGYPQVRTPAKQASSSNA